MPPSKDLDKDLQAIRALAEVLDDTGLSEVEIEREGVRLRVSRGGVAVQMAAPAPGGAAAPAPGGAPASPPAEAAEDLSKHPGAVTSPMVGTAYLAPSPGAAPFVAVGTNVSEGQTLMIVEAMKTMNEIKSPKSGSVKKILAQDAEPIEFGEVLMIIE